MKWPGLKAGKIQAKMEREAEEMWDDIKALTEGLLCICNPLLQGINMVISYTRAFGLAGDADNS